MLAGNKQEDFDKRGGRGGAESAEELRFDYASRQLLFAAKNANDAKVYDVD